MEGTLDRDTVAAVFEAADSRVPTALPAFFSKDICFRFGNAPVIEGLAAVTKALEEFYEYVVEIQHEILGIINEGNAWSVETVVYYRDRFGRRFQFPAVTLMFVRGGEIYDYRIFVDNSAMFQPPAEA